MKYPLPVCYFCGKSALGEYVVTSTGLDKTATDGKTPPREFTMVHLCQVHHDILAAAGERGRVYKLTGERWWFGRPELFPSRRRTVRSAVHTG